MFEDIFCERCRQRIVYNRGGWWDTVEEDGEPLCSHLPRRSDGVYQVRARSRPDGPFDLELDTIAIGTERRVFAWAVAENAHQGWERYIVVKIRDL